MNEYLFEMTQDLTDEEFMEIMKFHKRKNYQKENYEYGEESDYDFYC